MPASTTGIKISAKADEQWSASQKCNLTKIDGRPAKHLAGGNKLMAGGLKPWPVMCGDGQQAIPCPSKAKHKCLVQNQTQNSRVERSWGKARGRDLREPYG